MAAFFESESHVCHVPVHDLGTDWFGQHVGKHIVGTSLSKLHSIAANNLLDPEKDCVNVLDIA